MAQEAKAVWDKISGAIKGAFFSINWIEEMRERLMAGGQPEHALCNLSMMYRRRIELVGELYILLLDLEKLNRSPDVGIVKELIGLILERDVVNKKTEQEAVLSRLDGLNPFIARTA